MRVLIIGGGIAGLNCLIELINIGYDVVLVDDKEFLGGNALRLYKYFPSYPLDCSFCIQSCNELSGIRKCIYRSGIIGRDNVKIYTLSEIKEIKSVGERFLVKILKKPRYVDENKCINCKRCEKVCEVIVEDKLIGKRKAIYINNNGIPPSYVIDMKNCKRCGKCLEVCKTNAINLEDREREFEEEVDRIILAMGFEEYKPLDLKEYGYGKSPFIITQTELAEYISRMRNRLEINGKRISKILMVQCVCSRDSRYFKYCSKICCMYALKHAILLKEMDENIDIYIAFMDIRSYGFYEFWYSKARELGIKFIRGRPGEIQPLIDGVKVFLENTLEQKVEEMNFDLVVLSSALIPNKKSKRILEILGLEIDEYGFIKDKKHGIEIAGTIKKIGDIPETVLSALSATYYIIEPKDFKDIEERKKEYITVMSGMLSC